MPNNIETPLKKSIHISDYIHYTFIDYLSQFKTSQVNLSQVNSSTFKTSDEVKLDFKVTGAGIPLVMLHSTMMSRDVP